MENNTAVAVTLDVNTTSIGSGIVITGDNMIMTGGAT